MKVVYGGGKGSETVHQDLDYVPDAAEADDGFGQALASVDYDEDGYTDLVVGTPAEDIGTVANAGTVTVLYGSPDGLGKGKAALNLVQGTGAGTSWPPSRRPTTRWAPRWPQAGPPPVSRIC